MAKAKLGSRDEPVEVEPGTGRLSAPGEAPVNLSATKRATKDLVGTILFFLGMLVAVVAVLYVSLAATLVRFVPGDNGELTLVRSGTFVGGIPEKGDDIFISMSQPADNSFSGKLTQAFSGVPDAAILTVVAGPHGSVSNDPSTGELLIEGNPTGSNLQVPREDEYFLKNEYLVYCVSGACEEGKAYIVPQDYIIGEPGETSAAAPAVSSGTAQ